MHLKQLGAFKIISVEQFILAESAIIRELVKVRRDLSVHLPVLIDFVGQERSHLFLEPALGHDIFTLASEVSGREPKLPHL